MPSSSPVATVRDSSNRYSNGSKRNRRSSSSRSRSPIPHSSPQNYVNAPVRRSPSSSHSSSLASNTVSKKGNKAKKVDGRSTNRRDSSSSRSSLSSNSPRRHSRQSAKKDISTRDNHFAPQSQNVDLFGKTGGAYIPPARLRQMQAKITDKNTDAYQRIAWEALKKSIHGLINKVNVSNISQVVRQLLMENIIRGRGLLVKSLITSQMTSPTFTHIFAALIAIINTKFPQIGELLLKRLINEFRKAFRRNQKDRCLTTGRFLAHLVNQKVAHELIVLELLTLLLEQTTNDSVEVSVALLKECGAFLSRVVPKGLSGIFDHLRRILNESQCDKRISYMIEVLLQIRRDNWRDYPIVIPELDLIEEDDQITHMLSLSDEVETEDSLNIYHFDSEYEANECKYIEIRKSFLGEDNSDESGSSGCECGSEDSDEEEGSVQGPGEQEGSTIVDQTETNLVHLRRTIYLMLQSSISADEGAHRLLQLKIKPGEEYEVASMVLDCCAQTRSYETRYGSLAQRLCRVMLFSGEKPKPGEAKQQTSTQPSEPPRTYVAQFERIFGEQYATIHRLETAKLKNVAMFFAHLLFTDSISWGVLECVKLNERDTSSSGRIFLKFLFQELCSFMGLAKLQARLRDETLQPFFVHLLPRNNPKDTRFAINFLITIGLGGLTIDLREHLQATKAAAEEKAKLAEDVENSSSDSGSESSSSSDSESSSSDSTSSTSSSGSSSNSSESESESSGSVEEPPLKRKRIEKRTRGHGPPDGDLNEVNKHPSDSLDDLRVKENGDRHDRHANKPESRRDGQVSLESGHGQRKGKRTTAPLSSGVQERRLDSPISPSLSRRVGGNGNDGNIRNASPPASVTNRSPAKANGRSKRREREPSRVLEERRSLDVPGMEIIGWTPLNHIGEVDKCLLRRFLWRSRPPPKKIGQLSSPSNEKSRKETPTPPPRGGRQVSPTVFKSPKRRKPTPTPNRRGSFNSPPRIEKRRAGDSGQDKRKNLSLTPPRGNRYASPPSAPPVKEVSGTSERRKVLPSHRGRYDSPPSVRRRRTPSPHRRNRYASPSPEAKENSQKDSSSPRRSRYDLPTASRDRRNRYAASPSPQKLVPSEPPRRRKVTPSPLVTLKDCRQRTPSPFHRNRRASPSPLQDKLNPPLESRKGRYDSPHKDLKRDGQGREASKGRKG
nr:cell cycle control protein cwf22 [Hymenolepis microstoma]